MRSKRAGRPEGSRSICPERSTASLSSVTRVEVLPFHQMGRDKWADLGMAYELSDARPPENSEVEAVRAIFRSRGLTVH